MNTNTLKAITVAVSLIAGMGAASPAMATATGAQSLEPAANAIDVFIFTCPAGFNRAQARVNDTTTTLNNPALMQVVLSKDGNPTVQRTDVFPVAAFGEGGTIADSTFADVGDGSGAYFMVFKKTAGGEESYIGEAFCRDANDAIFNPSLTRVINQ